MAKVYGGIKSMLDKAAAKKFKDSTNDCEESKEDPSVSLGQGGGLLCVSVIALTQTYLS